MAEENTKVVDETVNSETTPKATNDKEPKADKTSSLSIEEQLEQLRLENARLKRATDKATSEASSYKKQLRAKQTEDEIMLQEKAEREAEREEKYQALVRENAINRLEKNFVLLGYNEEQAYQASVAQYDGDTDALFKIQNEVQASLIKAKEAEWLASRPPVNAGVGGEKPNISQEEFGKLGYQELVKFKNEYPETYKAYSK